MSTSPDRDERVAQLLGEIRDQQREQIALSREALAHAANQARLAQDAAERSMRNQEQAIAAQAGAIELQRRSARLYRVVVSIGGLVLLFAIGFLARLMFKYT